jgi:periplasmic divalent cation tolerance protein
VQTIGPIASRYRWQGKVEEATEWQCLVKTTAALYPQVETAIGDLHSYEEPEIIALPIIAGASSYLRWLSETTAE